MHNFGYDEEGWTGSLAEHRIWQRILRYCARHVPGLSLAVVLSLLVTAGTLAMPRLMQIGIDRYLMAANLPVAGRLHGLTLVTVGYGLLVAGVFLAGFLQVLVLERVGQSIMHAMRCDLFARLLDLDLAFFNRYAVGRLVTRLTNDIQNMYEMFTTVMVTLFNDFLKLAGILVLLFLMNSRLALLMTLFMPLSLYITIVFSRLARTQFRAIRWQLARLNGFLQESISGLSIIQLFARQNDSYRK
jgi:ATP-binding cassette subfamily B multidrug efflux pump